MNIPSNSALSLAAAHGITAQVVATWYPFLIRLPRVMVPVHVDALIVRKAGGTWSQAGMQTPKPDAKGTPLDAYMPPLFANLPGPRPAGAYLHWALPDALTKGVHQSDSPDDPGSTTFPVIPDRWLVLRLSPSKKDPERRTVRGWVLQSADQNPVAWDLDTWKETGGNPDPALQPFTCLGYGNISWAAYYDNAVNRLGFYDNLSDVPAGPIAYLVCGWYSDSTKDPLGDPNIHSLEDWNRRMGELKWTLPDTDFHEAQKSRYDYLKVTESLGLKTMLTAANATRADAAFDRRPPRQSGFTIPDGPPYVSDGSWWPQATVYHGSAVAIGWPTDSWPGNETGALSTEEGGPPSAAAVNVVVGNTIIEAMAALIGKATGSNKDARILEAFQMNVLPELDEPDGRSRLDALLHSKTFGSLPGGDTLERTWQPATGPEPLNPADPPTPGPGVFQSRQRANPAKSKFQLGAGAAQQSHAHVEAKPYQGKAIQQESQIMQGGLESIINLIMPQDVEPYVPGKWIDVKRSLPRLFHPFDPVILVQGARRSFKHGDDGKYSADGTLQCRISGTSLKSYNTLHGDIVGPPIYPSDILDRGVGNGSVPPECDELLDEMALLDPASADHVVQSAGKAQQLPADKRPVERQKVMVDQTAWWTMRDPRIDAGPVLSRVNYAGMLPSPVAVSPPVHPWHPLHLEWRVEFIPSPGGPKDWAMGEVDFNESVPKLPPTPYQNVLTFEGRSPVTTGANTTLTSSVRLALQQISSASGAGDLATNMAYAQASQLSADLLQAVSGLQVNGVPSSGSGADASMLEDIATALQSMDVVSGSLAGMHRQMRGGFPADGVSTPKPGDPAPSPFIPVRAGFIRFARLRLVDCFGQFVDLAGSGEKTSVNPAQLMRTEPLDVTGRPELLALPPRFTSPTRLWLRWVDAEGTGAEAALATDKNPAIFPICGYLMPNHLDQALEFFGADGANLGVIRPADDGSILWEDAPGRPSSVGQSPSLAIPNQYLGGMGEALLKWGVADAGVPGEKDTALQAILRVIDSTLWAVDPFGHHGDEHLALLVGHPIAVMRATLQLEVKEPVDLSNVNTQSVPVRLGALAQYQDGVLGYFVNDDYTTLYCCDAAAAGMARLIGQNTGFLQQANLVQQYYNGFSQDLSPNSSQGATPVQHPYVDTSGTIYVHPNQEVRLTMLVEPHGKIHATTGVTPRKEVGMRREWVTDALAKLAPTFRFGPVLIDPKAIRMPIAHEIAGTWSWDHRKDVNTWADDPVTHASQDAILALDPPVGSEGWLKLNPPEPEKKP